MSDISKELHRVVITAIIYNSEGKYLITQRSLEKKAWPGKWTVPGGGLTIDDYIHEPPTHSESNKQWYNTLERTLRREVREEVGLEIGKPEYLLDIAFIRPDNVPVITLSFYAPHISGEVVLQIEEEIKYAWVTLEEAKGYDLIPGIYEELELVSKKLDRKN